ncbi:hypothetical protein D3C72_2149840 [compost metagenome]
MILLPIGVNPVVVLNFNNEWSKRASIGVPLGLLLKETISNISPYTMELLTLKTTAPASNSPASFSQVLLAKIPIADILEFKSQ